MPKASPSSFFHELLLVTVVSTVISGTIVLRAETFEENATEEHTFSEEEAGTAEEESLHGRPVAPERVRLRNDEKDALREQNQFQERLGEEVSRMREQLEEQSIEVDIEAIREQAIERLEQAAGITAPQFSERQEEFIPHEPPSGGAVCFRSDGSTTHNRDECDADQGQHFGFSQERFSREEERDHPSMMYPPSSSFASPDHYEKQIENHFFQESGSQSYGPDVIAIIGEALQRLGEARNMLRGNAEAESQIQDIIQWLSGLLSEYAGRDPTPEESSMLAQEIMGRLQSAMQTVTASRPEDHGFGAGGGSFGPPPEFIDRILMMMEKMFAKIPQVFAIFEENGLPIAPDAYAAYEEAKARFAILGPKCKSDPSSCIQLREIAEVMESRMRPPMEQAIWESGQYDIGQKIEALMTEDMPMMPPGGPSHMGPPGGYGPPQGFGPPSDRGFPGSSGGGFGGPPENMEEIQKHMMNCMMMQQRSQDDCMREMMQKFSPSGF